MASVSNQALLANAKWSMLSKRYGEDPDKWRIAGAATLIGADVVEGYNKWAQASMNIDAIKCTHVAILVSPLPRVVVYANPDIIEST